MSQQQPPPEDQDQKREPETEPTGDSPQGWEQQLISKRTDRKPPIGGSIWTKKTVQE